MGKVHFEQLFKVRGRYSVDNLDKVDGKGQMRSEKVGLTKIEEADDKGPERSEEVGLRETEGPSEPSPEVLTSEGATLVDTEGPSLAVAQEFLDMILTFRILGD